MFIVIVTIMSTDGLLGTVITTVILIVTAMDAQEVTTILVGQEVITILVGQEVITDVQEPSRHHRITAMAMLP
jgi:hypothetical protein